MSDQEQRIKGIVDTAEDEKTSPTCEDAAVELKDAELSAREALLKICDEVEPWSSPEGEAYVSVRVDGHIEHYPTAAPTFRHWLMRQLATRFLQGGRPASANDNALKESRSSVEAQALAGGATHPAPIRITEHHGAIYIDLGSKDWSAIRVSEEGWSHITAAPVPILRGRKSAPFATPSIADFGPLRDLLEHLDNDRFVLLVAWCLGALLPHGPYPILILSGEQGSGKSTLARLLQRIVDPVHGDLLQPPGNDRDLIASAKHRRVLAFDNLSDIRSELADSLCRLATGSEIGGRALYTDHDTASFSACRSLIINGIPDLASRGDLEDRAIVLRLPLLPVRITEKEWNDKVEAVLPHTFAALLDALSYGMRMLSATATPDVRMADFARFIVAAEPRLPWVCGDFVAAYNRSRLDAKAILIENDAVDLPQSSGPV